MRRLLVIALACPLSVAQAQLPREVVARVDSVFAAIDRTTSPGCAVAVYRDGAIAHARGYGMANLEYGIANTPRSVFDIGSTSKQFSAAAIALLAQDGRLSLDDDVRKHVPELPAYQRPVTIRHLLNHTSGLRDYLTLMSLQGVHFDGVTTDDDALALIVRQKATNFEPGREFLYSNSGYFLLSTIVQRVSGKSLADFARERIFEPLGMRDTHFHHDHTMVTPRRATGYAPLGPDGGWRIDMSGFEQTGDGAVYTTVEDLLKWDANFYDPKVGGQRLLDDLHTQGRLGDGTVLDYALGLFVDRYRGARRVRHGGAWAGYRADLLRFPEHRTAVAALCNFGTANPGAYADRVADIVLADRLSPPPAATATAAGPAASGVAVAPARLERFAGRYRDVATGVVRHLTASGGALVSSLAPGRPLVAEDTARFRHPVAPITYTFETDASGKVRRLRESIGGSSSTTFEPFTAVTPTPAQLDEYAGRYYAEELDANIVVARDSSRLTVRFGGAGPRPLAPTVRDAFVAGGQMVLLFTRDAKGRVSAVTVNAGRVRGIAAVRR